MLNNGFDINLIVVFMFCGVVCGIVYNLLSLLKKIAKKNLMVCFFVDIVSCLISGLVFIVFVFKYTFGQILVYEVLFFVFGIVILQIFIKNSFARLIRVVYNKVNNKIKIVKK
ncbi:MAG: spore cortex biosynthesis protein YabQ [Clostridia bacterium]|nr:spore cortex biosynthesis protein YabQ [Clostridia bacterium]